MADKHTKKPSPPRDTGKLDPELNPQFSVPAEAEQPSGGERFYHAFWEVAKTVLFIVLAAIVIRAFIIQPFFVDGVSMEPTIHPSDYLIINQLSYKLGWISKNLQPERGDVIVFAAPPEPGENYIKRIIGLPGEKVELKDGRVMVSNEKHPQGVLLDEPYIAPGERTLPESEETSWTLGHDQYFVLGDNRAPGKSSDSRAWGPVPKSNIIGKASVRAYPLSNLGLIRHATYKDLAAAGDDLLAVLQPLDQRR